MPPFVEREAMQGTAWRSMVLEMRGLDGRCVRDAAPVHGRRQVCLVVRVCVASLVLHPPCPFSCRRLPKAPAKCPLRSIRRNAFDCENRRAGRGLLDGVVDAADRVPKIPGSARAEWRLGHPRQKSLAVPEKSAIAPKIPGSASFGWQMPIIIGSARAEWRVCRIRQESLAVPALSGVWGIRARNPWQCQC